MEVKGIIWLGVRTYNFDAIVNLYKDVMGLEISRQEPGFVVMDLPSDDRVEVFRADSPYNTFFTNPVAGSLVDDIHAETEANGIEFIVQLRRRKTAMPGVISARQTGLSTN